MKRHIPLILRTLVGLVIFCSGMSRLFYNHHFPDLTGTGLILHQQAAVHLSGYVSFVAVAQVVIGLLLITQRFATLGAVLSCPLLINTVALTTSSNLQPALYINLLLLLCNFYLLSVDYHKLKLIVSDSDDLVLKSPSYLRKFPFHDLVFAIGVMVVLVSPYVSYINVWLAYIVAAFGLATCISIQLYDKHLLKEIAAHRSNPL